MNEEDDGADTARNQIGNLPCFDYAQVTHTNTHTLAHTHSYRCAHTYSQHIVECVIGSYTHAHPQQERASLWSWAWNVQFVFCFSLFLLFLHPLCQLAYWLHHTIKPKKKDEKTKYNNIKFMLAKEKIERERQRGTESVKERKHSKLVSRLSNFKVSALRAFLPTNPIVTQSVYRFPVCFGLLLIFYTILRIGHTQISLRKFVLQTGSANG